MDEIAAVYKELEDQITFEEFKTMIDEKIDLMGGLCDEGTAAMMVAREYGVSPQTKICDIKIEKMNASFLGRVTQLSSINEFTRNDGTVGRVANMTLADETGSIRVAVWDEYTDLVKTGDISVGSNLKVSGYIKEGYSGAEVNIGKNGGIEPIDQEIKVKRHNINDISSDMSSVNVIGKVIDLSDIRIFQRQDGTEGKVKNLVIGDETGKIRVVLWGEMTSFDVKLGSVVEVNNGYSKDSYGSVEVHLGRGSQIGLSDKDVVYKEIITPIDYIELNRGYNLLGNITGLDSIREFVKKNGSVGRVANIFVSDDSGRIKVVLWDDHSEIVNEIDIGSPVKIIDGFSKIGRDGDLEINLGWRGSITLLDG
ncbi:MAG: OB-fold nucleic acid binding domain-containing protein [Halobacteriota archaeon]|nr:OB-fold nucleic acid binding domain-containing protein [Halobacteriota archaeon]